MIDADLRGDASWSEITAAIVAKCEVAAAFKQQVCWGETGADALGKLIKEMARLLDEEAKSMIDAAVAEERERCARIVEDLGTLRMTRDDGSPYLHLLKDAAKMAAAIRATTQPQGEKGDGNE